MARGSEILGVAAAVGFAIGFVKLGETGIHAVNYWQEIFKGPGSTPTLEEKTVYQARLSEIQNAGTADLPAAAAGLIGGEILLTAYKITKRPKSPVPTLNPES